MNATTIAGDGRRYLPRQPVVAVLFIEARRTEDRHAGGHAMQSTKTPQQLTHDPAGPRQLEQQRSGPIQKAALSSL
jgi:hypothetical protein